MTNGAPVREGGPGAIVVTGAGGFIGSAWCAHARAAGRPLRTWVRARDARALEPVRAAQTSSPRDGPLAIDLETASHDALVAALAGARAVVHLAGRAHRDDGGASSQDARMHAANVEATARLARAAAEAGVARFVYASSIKVHGEVTARGRPFRPDDRPAPQDAYARSKAAAEAALIAAAGRAPMEPVILRLPMVYGPGAKGNFRRLADAVAAGRWLPLAGIDNRRSLLSLANLMDAIDAALDAPAAPPSDSAGAEARSASARQVHLVADADSVSTPQLVRAIAAALGVGPRLVPVPVALLRIIGAATNRAGTIARLTDSLEADAASFIAWTGWRPRPFAIDPAMVAGLRRVQSQA